MPTPPTDKEMLDWLERQMVEVHSLTHLGGRYLFWAASSAPRGDVPSDLRVRIANTMAAK